MSPGARALGGWRDDRTRATDHRDAAARRTSCLSACADALLAAGRRAPLRRRARTSGAVRQPVRSLDARRPDGHAALARRRRGAGLQLRPDTGVAGDDGCRAWRRRVRVGTTPGQGAEGDRPIGAGGDALARRAQGRQGRAAGARDLDGKLPPRAAALPPPRPGDDGPAHGASAPPRAAAGEAGGRGPAAAGLCDPPAAGLSALWHLGPWVPPDTLRTNSATRRRRCEWSGGITPSWGDRCRWSERGDSSSSSGFRTSPRCGCRGRGPTLTVRRQRPRRRRTRSAPSAG